MACANGPAGGSGPPAQPDASATASEMLRIPAAAPETTGAVQDLEFSYSGRRR